MKHAPTAQGIAMGHATQLRLHSTDDGTIAASYDFDVGSESFPLDAPLLHDLAEKMKQVEDAEARSFADPARVSLIRTARRKLGQSLFDALDGAKRTLSRGLDEANRRGKPFRLVIRLTAQSDDALARHPGTKLRFELLQDASGPIFERHPRDRSLTVSLGQREVDTPIALDHGCLRILFVAYSPKGVEPVLDYEREEEALLIKLAPFIESGKVRIDVAEEGTIEELEVRLMRGSYDIVHLTGHGTLTPEGARLVMEDEFGAEKHIGAERLYEALSRAATMPRLVLISSCHSAETRGDLPSLTSSLVRRGVPAVLGWVRPVRDDHATDFAAELYERICAGLPIDLALSLARHKLAEADENSAHTSLTAGTLQYLASDPSGFVFDKTAEPIEDDSLDRDDVYEWLGNGKMKVLRVGFVGRRRELQALVAILRDKRSGLAGAILVGMKGAGKSCLAARAFERLEQAEPKAMPVVVHGNLDEAALLSACFEVAKHRNDKRALAVLEDKDRKPLERIQALFASVWAKSPTVVLLDDFEQNLELRAAGDARLSPTAAALLEILIPACALGRPKLLITTTASFELPPALREKLEPIPLGALDKASTRKLWARGRGKELGHVDVDAWERLADRLGRNARVLTWARELFAGAEPQELKDLLEKTDQLPNWKDTIPDESERARLAELFLRHIAFEKAKAIAGDAGLEFLERARVFDFPVPPSAFDGFTDDLALDLERHLPAFANLSLLERGRYGSEIGYRVSPLLLPDFKHADAVRWHALAAEFLANTFEASGDASPGAIERVWRHALEGGSREIADRFAEPLFLWMNQQLLHPMTVHLATEHQARFPQSFIAPRRSGWAQLSLGDPRSARVAYSRALELFDSSNAPDPRRRAHITQEFVQVLRQIGEYAEASAAIERAVQLFEPDPIDALHAALLSEQASVCQAMGDLPRARSLLERSIQIKKQVLGTDIHPSVAASLHELAGVLQAQGDLLQARSLLERSIQIQKQVLGTDIHPSVAASLHSLAGVLQAQGDLLQARSLLERSIQIQKQVLGTDIHPSVAASLHSLAGVLQAQGDLLQARSLLERSIQIQKQVLGTDIHPSVAASLHELAGVLKAQGDLLQARSLLERSIEIDKQVLGTDIHPSVAASLHSLAGVLQAQGDLLQARSLLERSIEIDKQVLGTDIHPSVAASLHELAGVLKAQGDLLQARSLLERSIQIKKQVLGTDIHPDVSTSIASLGVFDFNVGDLTGAEDKLRRSLAIDEQVFGSLDHYIAAERMVNLAMVLVRANKGSEAIGWLIRARSILKAQVPNHPLLTQLDALFQRPETQETKEKEIDA